MEPDIATLEPAAPPRPATSAAKAGPVPAAERILVLDVARGVALLGIFIMNVPGFSHSLFADAGSIEAPPGMLDRIVAGLREALVGGKFNSLFSLLFGIGFTLQLARLHATEPEDATLVYVRRLVVLGGIGLVHAALLWSGDVLIVYAVLGFVLLLLQRLPDAFVVAIVAACLVFPAAFEAARPVLVGTRAEALAAFDYQDLEATNNLAFGEGSFLDAVRETARTFAWGVGTTMGRWSYALFYAHMATGLFLGFLVGRRRWLQRLDALEPRLPAVQWSALAVGVGGGLAAWALRTGSADEPAAAVAFTGTLAHSVGRLAVMVFYALTLVRLVRHAPDARVWQPLAAAGRMPLSNYLLQTALGTFVFYAWGLGLWNRAGPAFETALAVGLYVLVQLPLSSWWLRHHRSGPLERLWRRLSYARSVD